MINISKCGKHIHLTTDESIDLKVIAKALKPVKISKGFIDGLYITMTSHEMDLDELRQRLVDADIAGDIRWSGFTESPKEDHIQTFNPD